MALLLVNAPAPAAATYTVPLPAPDNARAAILTVTATTDGTGTVAAKIVQQTPDRVTTGNIDLPGAATDSIGTGSSAVGRFLMWGDSVTATAGTSIDIVAAPVSQYQLLSYTIVANVTNLKIWIEYIV